MNAVEIDAGRGMAFVGGFTQATRVLQKPWIYAYDFTGQRLWVAYDQTQPGMGGDTRVDDMELDAEGRLYFAGEQSGGTGMFQRDPLDPAREVANAGYDAYQNPYALSGAAHIGYVGELDAATGAWKAGSFFVPRLTSGKGNSFKSLRVRVGRQGLIFITGASAYAPPLRDSLRVGGQSMLATGNTLIVVDRVFCRKLWVTYGTQGPPLGVAPGSGVVAVLAPGSANAVIKGGNPGEGAYLGIFPFSYSPSL